LWKKARNRGFDFLPGVLLGHEQGRRRRRCAGRWGPSAREREGRGLAAREEGEKRGERGPFCCFLFHFIFPKPFSKENFECKNKFSLKTSIE